MDYLCHRIKESDSNRLQDEYNKLVSGLRQAANNQEVISNPVLPTDILEGRVTSSPQWKIPNGDTSYSIHYQIIMLDCCTLIQYIFMCSTVRIFFILYRKCSRKYKNSRLLHIIHETANRLHEDALDRDPCCSGVTSRHPKGPEDQSLH